MSVRRDNGLLLLLLLLAPETLLTMILYAAELVKSIYLPELRSSH